MNDLIKAQYAGDRLYEQIVATLFSAGKLENTITTEDISAVDEFHVRGVEVNRELIHEAGATSEMIILDAGCGLGGLCRILAQQTGSQVFGADLNKEYIRTAKLLSKLTGLEKYTDFIHADVLQLPFSNEHFHQVWTQHVQMNIIDKKLFYSELDRVLIKGGRLIYYDIFSTDTSTLKYPLPWADNPNFSHLVTPGVVSDMLEDLGLDPIIIQDQTAAGLLFLERVFEKLKTNTLPEPNLLLLMGAEMPEKIQNLYQQMSAGKLILQSGIYQKPE